MDPSLLIGDVVERKPSSQKPPTDFDDLEVSATGFPAHRKRSRVSAFKQRRQGKTDSDALATKTQSKNDGPASQDGGQKEAFEAAERRRINRENKLKIENMTPEQIEKERAELLSSLNPTLIQRLLHRANIDEKDGPDPFDPPSSLPLGDSPTVPDMPTPIIKVEDTAAGNPSQSTEATKPPPTNSASQPQTKTPASTNPVSNEDAAPSQPPPDLFPIGQQPATTTSSTHFPAPPNPPDLDPSHPDFLSNLHEKFFPNLPADPSKLAWMAPVPTADSPADRDSPYYPGQESLPISALRFDFRGSLLPPRLSRSIPVTKGLHHHGLAPEAAGYTIQELAILARSAVPAQRCVAFQTLGRILYRLGKGEWGTGEDGTMARGIWSGVVEGRVLESLMEAAAKEGGHRGSQAYSTEALWLLEKGGWKMQLSGR